MPITPTPLHHTAGTLHPTGRRGRPVGRRAIARLLHLLLAVLLATLLVPAASHAGGGADWSIAPGPNDGENGRGDGSLAWVLAPGETVEDSIVVSNNQATALQLRINPRDAVTTAQGHLDLALDDVPAEGIGAWITLETDTLEIPAGEDVTVPFTLTVPEDATPGDYSGGIATSFDGEGSTVSVTYRLSSRVDVRVPGELSVSHEVSDVSVTMPSIWSPLSAGQATITYTLTNTGNARAYSNETIRVSGLFGLLGSTTSSTVDEVLPGSSIRRTVTVPAWALGLNTVELESTSTGIDEQRGTEASATEHVVAVNWSWVLILAGILTLGIMLGVRRGGRSSRARGAGKSAPARVEDQAQDSDGGATPPTR